MYRKVAVVLATLCVIAFGGGPSLAEVATGAIFQLVVVTHEGPQGPQGIWKGVSNGTAFFTSPGGKAITNSHVVFRAHRDPDRYHLLAIVGSELYSVRVACASTLPYDPTDPSIGGVQFFSRDVAQIQVMPMNLPGLETWGYIEYGTFNKVASAHWGSLPSFETLTVADDATVGDHVEVPGFGFQSVFRHPRLWTADGVVTRTQAANDGTRVFEIESTLRAQRGNSGSPVLNAGRHVVGLWTWYSPAHAHLSWAQGNAALAHPCD